MQRVPARWTRVQMHKAMTSHRKPASQQYTLEALPLPNALYGAACVTGYHNWATEEFARVLFGEAVMLPNDEVFDDVVTLA